MGCITFNGFHLCTRSHPVISSIATIINIMCSCIINIQHFVRHRVWKITNLITMIEAFYWKSFVTPTPSPDTLNLSIIRHCIYMLHSANITPKNHATGKRLFQSNGEMEDHQTGNILSSDIFLTIEIFWVHWDIWHLS